MHCRNSSLFFADGASAPEIATLLGVHDTTVRDNVRKYDNALDIQLRKNGKKSLIVGQNTYRENQNTLYDKTVKELLESICEMFNNNPGTTCNDIYRSGVTRKQLNRIVKEHNSYFTFDLKQRLDENGRAVKSKPVSVSAPDGNKYDFPSIEDARRELEKMYNWSFPDSSVRRCLARQRGYKGFLFRIITEDDCQPGA